MLVTFSSPQRGLILAGGTSCAADDEKKIWNAAPANFLEAIYVGLPKGL